jgi:hypothetical protein
MGVTKQQQMYKMTWGAFGKKTGKGREAVVQNQAH